MRGIVFRESDNLKYIRKKIRHGRRGGPMKETYWDLFMMSGKIEDYLSYKMNQAGNEQAVFSADRKEKCESDCTDRDGTGHGACRRI